MMQDVMVVGEPSLMGGEFGEEDERCGRGGGGVPIPTTGEKA